MKYYAGVHVLEPAYMREFACIGEDCENNCCRGGVDIDKEAYKLYKALPDSPLKRKILDSIEPYAFNDIRKHAHMKSKPGEPCPMLWENGLCAIQRELGQDYFALSCYTVPRTINRLGNFFEKSLKLTCPEACRLVLLSQNTMEFEEYASDESARLNINLNLSLSEAEKVQPAWFEIRSAFIDILQDRRLDFGHRLLLAGLAAEELDKMNARGASGQDIVAFLGSMAMDYKTDSAAAELNAIKRADAAAFASLLVSAYRQLILPIQGIKDEQFVQYIRMAVDGLGLPAGSGDAAARYDKAKSGYLLSYMDERHIYEHYFVNTLFGRAFPHRKQKGLFEEYMIIVLYYFLLDMMLTGISGVMQGIGDAETVDFIHRFAKLMELEPVFEEMVRKFIASEKLCNIDAAMLLTVHDG